MLFYRLLDREFREGAVRIVTETGKPIVRVADDLGINPGTLRNWVKQDRIERGEVEGLSSDERAEFAATRTCSETRSLVSARAKFLAIKS